MTRRAVCVVMLAGLLGAPLSAQFFPGIVYDPTNYANAVLRYEQLQRQLAQLITTYQQIRTQYLLLLQQSQLLPVNMAVRYRSVATPWQALAGTPAFGTTTGWIATANTGQQALAAYARATETLQSYGGAMTRLAPAEAARVRLRYDRVQLTDATIAHGLAALGTLRGARTSVETGLRQLEDDSYARTADLNTQIAVLNKINATAIASARLAKDANGVLVSLLEAELLQATERREAAAQGINAHVAFVDEAPPLLARTTAHTTHALATFRIP